jgi:ATP-binding cassette, subfamily B, multidrug efflux pump
MNETETALRPLRKYRIKIILAPILKLFESALELLTPFLIRYVIDYGIANDDVEYVIKIGALMLAFALGGFVITMIAQYMAARVSSDYGYDIKKSIYRKMETLSEGQLNSYGKQKTLTLVNNDSFAMQNGVAMFMRLLFRSPFLLIGCVTMAFLVDWRAGVIMLAVLLFSSLVIGFVMIVSPKHYGAIQTNLDEISTFGNDALKGARPVRAFNKQDYEREKFGASVENYRKKSVKIAYYNALINPLTFCFVNIGIALIVWLGGFAVNEGTLTTGEIVSLLSYLSISLTALIMFSRLIISLNRAYASKKRIDAFLALDPGIVNKATFHKSDDQGGDELFCFDKVSLTYGQKDDKPAISDLTFSVKKGSWVGLIGGTGSGKSTTLALLERLYDPTSGSITYRGHPLTEYDTVSLRKEISLVSQKPSIFAGTIRSNLLVAKPDATETEMEAVLKDALAYEYVSRYPDYLDHPIEESGANLSGGQKQRLLIARALLKGGDLLILDDSTSALDYLSDLHVRQNIAKRPGLTKIIVSQRAGTLRDCDLILVYDNGRIVAQGTHEELLLSSPIYHEIYQMQVLD